jgi:hypothetical protein
MTCQGMQLAKQSDEKLEKKASTNNTSITRCLSVETLMLEELLNHYYDLCVIINRWASTV